MAIKTKCLVTGGGGFLGQAIVKLLIKRGSDVVSFSRHFHHELASMGVLQIQGDIADKTAVENACGGIDTVFHVAAKPGVWGPYDDYFKTNVIGTKNIVDACFTHNVSILIYTGSPSVVFNGADMEGLNESVPYSADFQACYPQTKAMAEQIVVKATKKGLNAIILRPHLIWGPKDNHLVPRIIARAKQLIKVGNGKNLVDTIYIDNAADAHILAADRLKKNPELSGNIYFISQDQPVPLWDMVNDILKAAGLETVKRSIPKKPAWLIGYLFETIYKKFNIKTEPPITRFVAEELATSHWFDISAAKKDLGYAPKISIKEGLVCLEDWLENWPENRLKESLESKR